MNKLWALTYMMVPLTAPARAHIVPLSDACKPFLCDPYSTNYVAQWGRGGAGMALFNSEVVDVRREGIRFITEAPRRIPRVRSVASAVCTATPHGLCVMQDDGGVTFPTSTPTLSEGHAVGGPKNKLADTIAADDTACGAESDGTGRAYVASAQRRFDISLCSLQRGRYSVTYAPTERELVLYRRMFGPMAYTLILILCTVNLTGLACIYTDYHSAWTLYMVNATCSLCVAFYYIIGNRHTVSVTDGDYAYLTFTSSAGIIYCICGLVTWARQVETFGETRKSNAYTRGMIIQQGACLHALDTLGMLVYHTPETPYSFLFLLVLAARMWSHGTRSLESSVDRWWNVADAAVCSTHWAMLAQFGVAPQVMFPETWPAILGTIVFVGHVWVHCDCNSIIGGS